MSTSRISWRMC